MGSSNGLSPNCWYLWNDTCDVKWQTTAIIIYAANQIVKDELDMTNKQFYIIS